MPATQTASRQPDANPPSFETVWAILQETSRQMQETDRRMQETDRRMQETDRQMQETDRRIKETDRILKEGKEDFNRRLGSLTNLFGDFTLGMVAPKLCEKFMDYGLIFPKSNPNAIVDDRINKISFEIDIMLENGEKAMLVEVKTKLTKDRIHSHIERLEKMRKYANLHGDKRTFLGAVAGFAISDEVRKTALQEGFYLIEPDGENFNITPPNDKPKEW